MVDTILFTNTDGEITLSDGDDYFLGEGITHYKTVLGDVLDINGTGNNDIFVNGSVVNLGTGEAINVNAASSGVSITVGVTGSILGSSDSRGIQSFGDFAVVSNNGLITGGESITMTGENNTIYNNGTIQNTFASSIFQAYAIQMSGIGATLMNTGHIGGLRAVSLSNGGDVTNTGTILATGVAVFLSGNFDAILVNTGTITSSEGDAVEGASGIQTIANSGTINGIMDLGSGADILFNSGGIIGDVDLGDGENNMVNNGDVLGDIESLADDDVLKNSGDIFGDVSLGEGANFLRNSGLIDGDVDSGSGTDIIKNEGTINGHVNTSDDADTVINSGTINGFVDLGGGDDVYFAKGEGGLEAGQSVFGGTGNDTIIGGTLDDTLYGEDNNDTIKGGLGGDFISGGSGNDTLKGGGGDDEISGDDGNDTIYGGLGDDLIDGGLNSDTIEGGKGDDDISGGNGGDTLTGGKGDDTLTGGGGGDAFVFSRHDGNDVITDFADGSDIIDLTVFGLGSKAAVQAAITELDGGLLVDLSVYGGSGTVLIENMILADFTGADFIY